MKYIKLFEKYYQDLYHFTSVKNLLDILISNQIKSSPYYGNISLTRNYNFFSINRDGNMQEKSKQVRINMDAEKLKNSHKIKPFNYFKSNYDGLDFKLEFDEDEEVTNKPININYFKSIVIEKKYLKTEKYNFYSIEMNKKTLDVLGQYYNLDDFYDHNENYRIFNDYEILKVVKILCKEKNIPLILL